MPGPLVQAIGPLHVPVSRRRVLRRRFARLGSARARPVRVPLSGRSRIAVDQSGRNADAGPLGRGAAGQTAVRLINIVADWFDRRLQLGAPIRETMEHPVPRDTASWAYVFGSAALTTFALQVVTGILLALAYVPSAGEAWNSLQHLNQHVTLGWFVRALHGWGSNFMIAIVIVHMMQVFLFGAYKFP